SIALVLVVASAAIGTQLAQSGHQRTLIGVAQAWSARVMITLVMFNGGLGLSLAGGHGAGAYTTYGVVLPRSGYVGSVLQS
ncbi:hypothetical protein D0867_08918, partial [Hortaea werneckii]